MYKIYKSKIKSCNLKIYRKLNFFSLFMSQNLTIPFKKTYIFDKFDKLQAFLIQY